jgi:hypothetical protein
MRTVKFVAAPIVAASLVMVSLVAWAASAGASEPPPVVLRNPRAPTQLCGLWSPLTVRAEPSTAGTTP